MPSIDLKKLVKTSKYINKTANNEMYDAMRTVANRALQRKALMDVGRLGLTGLGLGVGARGTLGLVELLKKNLIKRQTPHVTLTNSPVVTLPFEQIEEPDKEKEAGVLDFLKGDSASTMPGIPWYYPAAALAGGVGAGAGWSALDYLLDRRRKGDLKAELDKAKQDYETALMENSGRKLSSDKSELNTALTELYDTLTKVAGNWEDYLGQLIGLYGVGALGAGIGSGIAGYNFGVSRQNRELLNKAIKERRKRKFEEQPPPILVNPTNSLGNATNPTTTLDDLEAAQ